MTTSTAHWPKAEAAAVPPWIPLGAVAGPVLFTVAWLTLGFLSPGYRLFGTLIAPYSSVSQPISGLGLGPTAPFMNAAFVLSGLSMVLGVAAIFAGIRELSLVARWSCAGLLALPGLGCVMDGIFTLESMRLHFAGFLLAAGSPIVGFPVVGLLLRRVPGWRRFGNSLFVGGPLTLALLAAFFATFDPGAAGAGVGIAGLTGRALSLEIHAWFVALGWLAFRRNRLGARSGAPTVSSAWSVSGLPTDSAYESEMAAPRSSQDQSAGGGARHQRKEFLLSELRLKQVPAARTGMLIRRPVAEVFEAFVNPAITTKFWFTNSSGKLEAGKQVQWGWEMYGISIAVAVTAIEPMKRIVIEWAGYRRPTTVEWTFTALPDGTTFVSITDGGFEGDGDDVVQQALDSTQGFALVLAGLKALLEHDLRLNLVADRFPKGIESH